LPLKLVYTHPSIINVAQARSSIEQAGIDCVMRNEYAAGALGELAPIDAWPELWVKSDRHFDRATQVIEQLRVQEHAADWQCAQCGVACPDTFDWCWKCATDRYAH
jgi:hypothetical protein